MEKRKTKERYEYLDDFASLLDHPKALVRNRVLYILAANAQWDEENRFDSIISDLQIKTVLKELKVIKVDNYISFDEFLVAVSEKISPYSDRQYMIQEDIRKRERLGSQVFSSMGFSLFHARTSGVVKPAFMVCLTKNKGVFYDSYFQGIDVCLVMRVPDDEHAEENGKILSRGEILKKKLIIDIY